MDGKTITGAFQAAGISLAAGTTDAKIIEALKAAMLPESFDDVAAALKAAGVIVPAPPVLRPIAGLASGVGYSLSEIPYIQGKDAPGSWRSEYTVEGFACPQIELVAQACNPPEGGNNNLIGAPRPQLTSAVVRPVQLEAVLGCSTFDGHLEEDYWRGAVLRALDLCQFNALAYELWTGAKSEQAGFGNKFLASTDAVDVVTGLTFSDIESPGDLEAAWLVDAVAAMEDALGKCTCGAVHAIHTSPKNTAYASQCHLLVQQGNRLFTQHGTQWLDDDGYDGTGPLGAPDVTPSTNYIYGTSTVSYRIDSETHWPNGGRTEDWVKMGENNIKYQGQRWGMATWLCCHFMARVQLG